MKPPAGPAAAEKVDGLTVGRWWWEESLRVESDPPSRSAGLAMRLWRSGFLISPKGDRFHFLRKRQISARIEDPGDAVSSRRADRNRPMPMSVDREPVGLAPVPLLGKPAGKGALDKSRALKNFGKLLEGKRLDAASAPDGIDQDCGRQFDRSTEREGVSSKTPVVEGEFRLGFPVGDPPSAAQEFVGFWTEGCRSAHVS